MRGKYKKILFGAVIAMVTAASAASVSGCEEKRELTGDEVYMDEPAGGYVSSAESGEPEKPKKSAPRPKGGGTVQKIGEAVSVSYEPALANSSDIEQGCILDERFVTWPIANNGLMVNGWDIASAGGESGILVSPYNYFGLFDDDENGHMAMSRHFVRQSKGRVTIEIVTGITDASLAGSSVAFFDSGKEAFGIYFGGGEFVFKTEGTETKLAGYELGFEYGVKLTVDFKTKKAEIMIDGAICAEDLKFKAPAIDSVEVSTSDSGKGSMYLNYIGICRGYAVSENFMCALGGVLPSDWKMSGMGKAYVRAVESQPAPDTRSLVLEDESSEGFVNIYRPFENISAPVSFRFKFLSMSHARANHVFRALHKDKTAFYLCVENGAIYFADADRVRTKLCDYAAGVWFDVEIRADPKTDIAGICINHKHIADIRMYAKSKSFDGISLSTAESSKSDILIDDIAVSRILPEPEDYVPVPVPAAAMDGKLVGMLRCDLWRSSEHLGWDRVNGFENSGRMPIFGWYDDGNPEVADWEIKMLVEHGVAFQIPCWYRPQGASFGPIKKPSLGSGLHDGYFNSKYSEMLKFALLIETQSGKIGGMSDWKENVVPFLVEYYLKDGRYLVVEGKPVIFFYGYSSFAESLGGEGAVKEALEYLRAECVKIGYFGAELVICVTPMQKDDNKKTLSSGAFDYSFAYGIGNLGESASGNLAANIDTFAYDDAPNFLAALGVGFDSYPWNATNLGSMITPEELYRAACLVKDEYMAKFDGASMQGRMCVVDNWNEFSEGHYFLPTNDIGYSYLDMLRGAFCGESEHEDIAPTKTQRDRLSALYPQDRLLAHPPRYPGIPSLDECARTIKRWDFETGKQGFSGLGYYGYCGDVSAEGGYLTVRSAGRQMVRFELGAVRDVGASEAYYLRIRLAGDTSAYDGRVYFGLNRKDIDWGHGTRALRFEKKGDGYTDYIADIGRSTVAPMRFMQGAGDITSLQIWFYSMGADVIVDFIEFIGN